VAVEPLQLEVLVRPLAVLAAQPVEPLLDDAEVVEDELGVEVPQLALRSAAVPSAAGKPRTTRQNESTSESARSAPASSPEPFPAGPGTSTNRISA
jgi:hypothetical protein